MAANTPNAYLQDYVTPSAIAESLKATLANAQITTQAYTLEELERINKHTNPLNAIKKPYGWYQCGSIRKFMEAGEMIIQYPGNAQNVFKNPNSATPMQVEDAKLAKKNPLTNVEMDRACIISMKIISTTNDFGLPMELSFTGIPPSHFMANQSPDYVGCSAFLPPLHRSDRVTEIYGIPPDLNLVVAMEVDRTSIDDLHKCIYKNFEPDDVNKVATSLINATPGSPLLNILTSQQNTEYIRKANVPEKFSSTYSLHGAGFVSVVPTSLCTEAIQAAIRGKEAYEKVAVTVDFSAFHAILTPFNPSSSISWATIESHDRFKNMSKKEIDAFLDDPNRFVYIETEITYFSKNPVDVHARG